MWVEEARTRLAEYKERECDGILWEDRPTDADDEAISIWLRETWDKFDNLPLNTVEKIIRNYSDLYEVLIHKADATIGDAYDVIYEVENWAFDDLCALIDDNEESFAEGKTDGYDYVVKANKFENAFGIEETQCICNCCSHSGKCPMEDAHNTTYGTFVTGCRFYDYEER